MEKHKNKHKKKQTHKTKTGVWKISTVVLLILLVASIFTGGFAKINSIGSTEQTVADKAVKFINDNILQGQGTATLKSIEESNGVYQVILNVGDQETEAYVSSNGKLLFLQAINLDEAPQDQRQARQRPQERQAPVQNLEKSDKPMVELFVMSHCPYGTQMEKGILPVVKELGDKIDFELKFVNYAMHPTQGEVEEQLNQYCIQRDYNDKYFVYLSKFLEAGDGQEALNAVGLGEADITQCVEETDQEFDVIKNLEDRSSWANGRFPAFMIHDADNKKYGVRGSPTLVINGQQAQSERNAQSILNTICSAFTDKPEECNTDMTSFGNPAPGFGFGTQGGSATAAGCGT